MARLTRRAVVGLAAVGVTAGGFAVVARDDSAEHRRDGRDGRLPVPRRYGYGDHPRQVADLYRPDGDSRGTVVMLHGGFWQSGYDLSLNAATSEDLARRGWTVWNLDYRGVGEGGGWPETFRDVRSGVRRLGDLAVEVGEVVFMGHSAGGQLAVWAAGEDTGRVRAGGAVPMAGVLALTQAARNGVGGRAVQSLLGGAPADVTDRYAAADPLAHVPLDVPVRCVHGSDDYTVPLRQSETYVAAARAAGGDAELITTPGSHLDALDPASLLWRRTVQVLAGLSGDAGAHRSR